MTMPLQDYDGNGLPVFFGARIDALDAVLGEFDHHRLESLIALRRQIQYAGAEARDAGLDEIAAAAEIAHRAGVMDARRSAEALVGTMRETARVHRESVRAADGTREFGTGLMSREAFAAALGKFSKGNGTVPAVIAAVNVTDLDAVRERHGAKVSSRLLIQVGDALARLVREEDCVARFDGGGFVIFLPGEDERGLARALARINTALESMPFVLPDGTSEPVRIKVAGHPMNARDVPGDGNPVPARAQLCVGIISHSAATTKVLEGRLQREGFAVVRTNHSGDHDMSPLSAHHIHVVIVDEPGRELAPVMTGLRKALARRRSPVVVLVQSEEDGHRALGLGASEFLVRPVGLDAMLKVIHRLVNRGQAALTNHPVLPSSRLLVVSNDMYALIAFGSALQKQAGYEVCLARGSADAIEQVKRHSPSVVLLDLRLQQPETAELLARFGELFPASSVILVVGEDEPWPPSTAKVSAQIKGAIRKPVHLLALADDLKEMIGVPPSSAPAQTAAVLQAEILRIMQLPGAA